MAQTQHRHEASMNSMLTKFAPAEFVELSQKQVDAILEMQKELFSFCQEIGQNSLGRVQMEAGLALKFTQKIAAANSPPDVALAYQEWVRQHMNWVIEDSQKLAAEGQKLADASRHFLSNDGRKKLKSKLHNKTSGETSMGTPNHSTLVSESLPDQGEADELLKRLRKLRWIGMEEEAARLQLQSSHLPSSVRGVLAEPCCTD